MKKAKKGNLSTVILILVFIAGLSLLLYPTVSDYCNSFHQTRAIAQYAEQVANLDEGAYEELFAEAEKYNHSLIGKENRFLMTEEERTEYESILNISDSGIMGYIEIPKIKVELPVYHGTAESVLQIAVGHVEGSSLPVGGEGTHCVLSGHRGLPSARLFTDLDELVEGDTFIIQVLNRTLTYEIDQIRIVDPDELDDLEIEEDKDYCTLVTCTPYGINTHRMLVRGHRIENSNTHMVEVTADATAIDPVMVAPLVAAPILLILLIVLLWKTRKKKGGV